MLMHKSTAEPISHLQNDNATQWKTWHAALSAAILGAVIIYGVGFAPGIAHGESHDTRHTMGFVCH